MESYGKHLTNDADIQWGRPPLALIPTCLASRLNEIPLPDWLTKSIEAPLGTAADLTSTAWSRLPGDEHGRDQVRRYVVDLVASHVEDLRDVEIGALENLLESALLDAAPGRTRNALLRIAKGRRRDPLTSVTFGEILDARLVGIRTALEVAAFLEMFSPVSGVPNPVGPASDLPQNSPAAPVEVRWGEPGTAVLPLTLRRAFADEVLPGWLLRDLYLPVDATALALDASIWRHLDRLPRRDERFLLGLITYRMSDIERCRVVESPWPSGLRVEDVPWPTRVRNALIRAELLDSERLARVTYGTLLSIPAMGVKSVLDFAAVAEDVMASSEPVLDESMRHALMMAIEQEWAERVRADDPRFRDVAPPYNGSLSELFDEALNNPQGPRAAAMASSLYRIQARVAEIASEPLDEALRRLITSVGSSQRDVAIIFARFGWGGRPAMTLQEVGDEFSLTRERVRQIVGKRTGRISQPYLPQLEKAVRLVASRAPIASSDAARLLVDEGVSMVPIDPRSLMATAELLGYDVDFQIDPGDGAEYVLAQGLAGTGPVFSIARRQAGRVGVSNIEEVHADLADARHDYPIEAVSRILHSSLKVEFLVGEWFWVPGIPPERNRLRNVTRRMLSVTPTLDIASIRQGVRRRYRFMQIDLVPPTDVLRAFFSASAEFMVHGDSVEPIEPLDYRDELGEVERVFVEVLRGSATGLLDRAELEEAVTGRGVNGNTFSVVTSYSPILDHPATNVWCLRGHDFEPATLEALRAAVATRSRRRRTLAFGWDEDGNLWLTVEVANVGSPVIGIPVSIARYLSGRRFDARTQDGTTAGSIIVDESGVSWGYGPFLRRRGAEPGDALTLRFDLASEVVTLSLDDDSALVDDAG